MSRTSSPDTQSRSSTLRRSPPEPSCSSVTPAPTTPCLSTSSTPTPTPAPTVSRTARAVFKIWASGALATGWPIDNVARLRLGVHSPFHNPLTSRRSSPSASLPPDLVMAVSPSADAVLYLVRHTPPALWVAELSGGRPVNARLLVGNSKLGSIAWQAELLPNLRCQHVRQP